MHNRVVDTFNQLASVYEHTVDTMSLYNSEYERPAMMQQLPQDLQDLNILDAGCAAGWYTEQLVDRGAHVVATDISPEMVSATKRRIGNKANVLCLDLQGELPFEDRTFDIIISSLTLHYLKEWGPTLKEFQRVLKPDGLLLFSIHHPFSDIKLLGNPNYYFTELIIDKWYKEGKYFEVPFYRRPIHSIINETVNYFTIEKIIEPQPTTTFKMQEPEKYENLMKSPQFLIIIGRKLGER
ncbi:class I SAM-dependent methyltransferase [Metabacillus malikii]|uniref:Ubiquinone/menaquinone biosynthesis C-methylase UbiE n=1 Tax=Metabacillus malikii TaxID=1504265 RepID=A0ABT9ZA14_9BACI|nr:class I SAM-dependent methyltransferase [Metabacillus malikii]MDQ0229089.1 ubiquinone/menaquinone biosynthesis C-methylase UbiE [Metabacillus malikii]